METKPTIRPPSRRAIHVVQLEDGAYFVDLSREELWRTFTPDRRIAFGTQEGKAICRRAGVVTCQRCAGSAIVAGPIGEDVLACMWCGARIAISQPDDHRP